MATDRKVWDLAGPSPMTTAVRPSATSIGRGALAMKTGIWSITNRRAQLFCGPKEREGSSQKTQKEQLKVKASVYKINLNLRPRDVLHLPLWLPSPQIFLNLFLKGWKRDNHTALNTEPIQNLHH